MRSFIILDLTLIHIDDLEKKWLHNILKRF